jgi:2-polyprenyl-6-hydroxyphenyl methylase/3-demethylubiquinone-9 3-methyltransferase
MMKQAKNTICLWYDGDAEEAARFYAKTFPDSSVGAVHRAPGDFPSGKQGDVLTVEFTVMGIPCLGLNGGPISSTTKHSRFRSQPLTRPKRIVTGTQSSTTGAQRVRAAGARTNGDCPGRSRRALWTKAVTDPDRAAVKRAFDAMMQMKKIDIAAIEAARRG